MQSGSSDLVRELAQRKYVEPALRAGRPSVTIAVRDLARDLAEEGFPQNHYAQICTAIQTGKFLRQNGLAIEKKEGPPSGLSSTVVVHYRAVRQAEGLEESRFEVDRSKSSTKSELAQPRTERESLLDLVGVLRGAIREGADAFVREVRRDKVASR